MNIHLIRTPEYPETDYLEVVELLNSFNGILKFVAYPRKFNEVIVSNKSPFMAQWRGEANFNNSIPTEKMTFNLNRQMPLSWQNLFRMCDTYRDYGSIPDEDYVVLITLRRNVLNWFASMDDQFKRNIFVQASDWENFIKCDGKYPVAYEIAAYILRNLMKLDVQNFQEFAHVAPIGCMNDFCQNKSQIILKLRTGDICSECQELLYKQNVNPTIVHQVLAIFEGIRKQMLFKQGFTNALRLSQMKIHGDYKIFLTDYGNIEIKLTPTQKSIYFLFLNHPGGIRFTDIADHRQELLRIYRELSQSANADRVRATVANICDDAKDGFRNLRTYISQIKSEFNKKIGMVNFAFLDQYCINGDDGSQKTIALDRNLLIVQPSVGFMHPNCNVTEIK